MPDSLGRYQLKRELGHGTMGVVYEGWDNNLNRQVAIKTIRASEYLDPEVADEYSRRFIQEARNAGQLMHPNIVTVFDFGNESGMDFLVMELIHGRELKAYLDAGHVFSIAESVVIACQLLEALDYVHGKHIFHRDIKPANVMLEAGTRRVRLTDFGVARFSAAGGLDGTRAGTVVGTPGFMSPEQINGGVAGAAADLFATGALLYQCLTLHRPFTGKNALETWQKTVTQDPPPMAGYRDQIPLLLERAVRHALAKEPLERPASARALIDELQDALDGEHFDADATRMPIVGGRDGRPRDAGSQPRARAASLHVTQAGEATGSALGTDPAAAHAGRVYPENRVGDGDGTGEPPPAGPAPRKPYFFTTMVGPVIGAALLILSLGLRYYLATSTLMTPAPSAGMGPSLKAAAGPATRSILPAPTVLVPTPVSMQAKAERIPDAAGAQFQLPRSTGGVFEEASQRVDGQAGQAHGKPEVFAVPNARPEVALAQSVDARANGTASGGAAQEANRTDARNVTAPREADDEGVSIQNEQARYLRLAQLAESKGDSHGALALYKRAYDYGSDSDATRSMREISVRAAQAMSNIFGRAEERIQALTWHINAKTMEAAVANSGNQ